MHLNWLLLWITLAGIVFEVRSTEEAGPTTSIPDPEDLDPRTPSPIYTGEEYISLSEDYGNVRIQHPSNGGRYRTNELLHWIITNEDPNAVGFRIDADYVIVGYKFCCDMLIINRDDCHFNHEITSTTDTPWFIPGSIMNITFTSDWYENTNSDGFAINVSAVYGEHEFMCPGTENEIVLNENNASVQIMHPENARTYDDEERYVWIIRNDDRSAAGFEITFDKLDIDLSNDLLRIEGDYCSYGEATYRSASSITIRGSHLNITWTSDFHYVRSGFIINVKSLQALNKTQCYEYICDDFGRCIRLHSDDRLNWYDSQAACEAEGARLVVITDEGMNDLVDRIMQDPFDAAWIGISGDSFDGMTWITGYSTSDYVYEDWNTDFISSAYKYFLQPNCGHYFGYTAGWYYWPCSNKMEYICELL